MTTVQDARPGRGDKALGRSAFLGRIGTGAARVAPPVFGGTGLLTTTAPVPDGRRTVAIDLSRLAEHARHAVEQVARGKTGEASARRADAAA